jgi:hypothetical protein
MHTPAAYFPAIQQFLAWSERAGYQLLEDIEPITVAAYIETLQRQGVPPTARSRPACHACLHIYTKTQSASVEALLRNQIRLR